ncbi:MAG TPA: efflux RND transporter periplasmic adaptor subunit, partial [Candidatus Krumholzibacteriaceae bacterium]
MMFRIGTSPRLIALAVLLTAAIVLPSGCASRKNQHKGPPVVPVMAQVAVSMDVPVKLSAIGTVDAFNTVSVTARVSGQLLHAGFSEGQEVEKGDLLFQIDPDPYEAMFQQAQANLDRDKAKQANAEADLARYADLVKKDYVTKEEYDSIVSTSAAAKATVQADEAAVQSARLNLDYCTIRAPIAGRTGNLLVKQGNLITANGGSPLVTINQIVPVYVNFTISEEQLTDVRRYSQRGTLAVQAYLPSDSANVYEGKLTFINNEVDERTGTILLKATFPNGNRALWPGQFVQVGLVLTKQRNAVVVPSAAVQSSQQGDYIYVVRPDSTADMRPVVQGTRLDDKVVIMSGVQAGEKVVTDGQLRLMPGAK